MHPDQEEVRTIARVSCDNPSKKVHIWVTQKFGGIEEPFRVDVLVIAFLSPPEWTYKEFEFQVEAICFAQQTAHALIGKDLEFWERLDHAS